MSDAPQLPTADEFFGPRQLPTADQFFGPKPQPIIPGTALGGEEMDAFFGRGSVGHLLDAFGQGAKDAWGTQPLGMSKETEADLRKAGIFKDYTEGHATLAQSFNEHLIRGTAAAVDAGMRAISAGVRGVSEVGVAAGLPRDLTPQALWEAFPAGHATGFPASIPHEVARAADLGVIGKGEAGWLGVPEATTEARQALSPTGVASATERVVPRAEPPTAPAEAAPAPDVHAVARQIAPDTFAEYDALSARKDTFREHLGELADARDSGPEAQALQTRIDDILGKVNGVEGRLTNAALRRLETARDDLDALRRADTPDMGKVRQDLQKTDIEMRDLAPDVSAAYREAQARMPREEAPAGLAAAAPVAEAVPAATEIPPAENVAPAPSGGAALPKDYMAEYEANLARTTAAEAPPAIPEPPPAPAAAPLEGGIVGDVAKKLVAAGRPAEEADAAAALVAAHYETRAARFAGAKGTAEELYRAEAPTVRAGRGVQPAAMEMAQPATELEQTRRGKVRLATNNARAEITLFKDADASTFIHETGHHWLEELMGDAADERAPADLKADAAAVHQWLGTELGGEIPRRAHEKFARGFERYMMEGHAPTQALADVFAKFRDWLAKIYQTVTQLRAPINDDIRGVFDRMLATKNEAVIAPDRVTAAPAREMGPTSRRISAGPYEPVPKEPRRLIDFLRREGGLKDEGGEISHIIGGKNQRPGLINGRGKSLDDAALRAWEEGYFPEHGENRPTINDLLDAIAEDARGNARYSFQDEGMATAFQRALDHNAEVDRLGDAMGINPRDFSRQEFFDRAAEHLSAEEQARELGALDAKAELDFAEAERRAKEWAESRGDAWEPDAVYGKDEPRTLEDLERDYIAQTEAAIDAGESQGGAVTPGPAAGSQGPLQERVRQGGRGPGDTGRAGAGASETPAGPHASFAPAGERLIDKAGNIRLDNLSIPDDIESAIRDAAARNEDFTTARRGVITDGQLLDLADAIGMDPAFLNEKAIGQAFSAEEILAARKLLVQSATAVRDAMVKAAAGTDADVAAMAQAIVRHEMIQGKVAQATAEWGRAGRAFRDLEGWEGTRDLNQLLKSSTGRTLNQLREMAQLGKSLGTPAEVSKLVADTSGGKVRQAIIYYWVNTLISGPITHMTYSIGNTINAVWTPLIEGGLAGVSGAARSALGIGPAERVYFREATSQIYGLGKGFRDGLGPALEAYKSGVSPALPSEKIPAQFLTPRVPPIPGVVGQAIGIPGKAVSAIHSFFKTVRYEQNIQALAMRGALSKGLEGNARDLEIARLTASPTEEMMQGAVADALKELYMRRQDYNSPMAQVTRGVNGSLVAKIILPFIKIGSEITRNALIERTPLGLLSSEVRGNLLMRNGGAAFDTQMGKMMAGTGLMAATVLGVLEGNITGDGPSDPDQRREWLLSHKPNHVSVGPISFSYARMGHLAMLTRFAANMTETAGRWNDTEGDKLAFAFFSGITRSILDENWMRGVKDIMDAIYHPEQNFDRWATGFVAQWTPFSIGLGQVARAVDPYARETRDLSMAMEIFNQAKAHTPLWSQTLPARRDMFGEPITTRGTAQDGREVAPTTDRYANDKVVQAMDALHIGIAPVKRDIRGVPLTAQQYDDYSRIAGRMVKMELNAIISPAFRTMSPVQQIKTIKDIVTKWHEATASRIMIESMGGANDIVKKANDSKVAAIHGASPTGVKEILKAH